MAILNMLTEQDIQRFHSKVDRSGGPNACWPFTDAPAGNGCGYLGVGGRKGRKIQAHQIAYELARGPIPAGHDIDHVCHNKDESCAGGNTCPHRRCVNDAHLEAVTHRVNLLRGKTVAARNAAVTHCRRGHMYDEANTRITPRRTRECRACDREEFRKNKRTRK